MCRASGCARELSDDPKPSGARERNGRSYLGNVHTGTLGRWAQRDAAFSLRLQRTDSRAWASEFRRDVSGTPRALRALQTVRRSDSFTYLPPTHSFAIHLVPRVHLRASSAGAHDPRGLASTVPSAHRHIGAERRCAVLASFAFALGPRAVELAASYAGACELRVLRLEPSPVATMDGLLPKAP
jgi:hypothetical protein